MVVAVYKCFYTCITKQLQCDNYRYIMERAYRNPSELEQDQFWSCGQEKESSWEGNQNLVGNQHQRWRHIRIFGRNHAPSPSSRLLLCTPSCCPWPHMLCSCLCFATTHIQLPPIPKNGGKKWSRRVVHEQATSEVCYKIYDQFSQV